MSKESLSVLLEKAREVASTYGATKNHGGMASVGIMWDPYEARWKACASWSSGAEERTDGSEEPIDAVMELLDLLEEK